jgi:hypothetical protein
MLVTEILKVLYVLRAGKDLTDEASWKPVLQLLSLENDDKQSYECKLGAITLLMDAPQDSVDVIMEHENLVESFLKILERQVSYVVDNTLLGNASAAALTPILVVLNKFCNANPVLCQCVKNRIFPPQLEDAFWAKAESVPASHSSVAIGANNMSPLDAPKGTLRWKLIRLMTWMESNVKRTANELLWTVCGKNGREFVLRTGIGNAMPFLGIKGLVPMPSHLYR